MVVKYIFLNKKIIFKTLLSDKSISSLSWSKKWQLVEIKCLIFGRFYKNAIKISKGIFKKMFFSLKPICHKTPIKCHNKNTHNIF